MVRQVQALRTNDGRTTRERATRMLYRDSRADSIIDTESDFFWLVRITFAVVLFGAVGTTAAVLGVPALLIVGIAGYNVPLVWASQKNKARQKAMIESIPSALRRLETRIAAGSDIKDAFAKVSFKRDGPLYAELSWAAGQMQIPGNEPYTIMRRIDERNGLIFFAPLADQVERASRRGRRDGIDAFLAYIDKVLEDDETRRQVRINALGNKVMLGMVPFLVFALMVAIGGPFVVGFIDPSVGSPIAR